LNWQSCRVKKRFGTEIDFPPFIVET